MHISRTVNGVWIAAVLCASSAVRMSNAQVSGGPLGQVRSNISAGNYYYVSKPGELTMEVNIWGSVRSPGRYEVPISTNLVQLVSYAGGPTQDAVLDEVRVTRFSKNPSGQLVAELHTVNLEDLSKASQAGLILLAGDTIYMDHSSWATFRDVFSVVTTVALVTSAIAQVVYASHR